MCAKNNMGLFVDYEYVHKTLERAYQIKPDPRQIVDAISKILDGCEDVVTQKKAYALWEHYAEAKQVFDEFEYETINTAYELSGSGSPAMDKKTAINASNLEMVLCCDIMEMINSSGMSSFYLVVGDGRYEVLLKRLKEKGLHVAILGFMRNAAPSLRQRADSFITLDDVIKRFHKEDIVNIVETYVSLSRKLPYVGYKYLMDILSRNDLNTDYRQLLNEAQEEGIIRLVEINDPNTVRGKAFAIKLVTEHPVIEQHLQDLGITADAFMSPEGVQISENTGTQNAESSVCADHSDTRFTTGKRLVEIGQHEAAISEFFNYLEDYPNDFLGFVYVINCLIRNGDRKQARAWCKKALNLPNAAHNQKEYPRWFTYMKRISSMEEETFATEEEQVELSG
jgi:uncharacterized LabA/DUF88 family protein